MNKVIVIFFFQRRNCMANRRSLALSLFCMILIGCSSSLEFRVHLGKPMANKSWQGAISHELYFDESGDCAVEDGYKLRLEQKLDKDWPSHFELTVNKGSDARIEVRNPGVLRVSLEGADTSWDVMVHAVLIDSSYMKIDSGWTVDLPSAKASLWPGRYWVFADGFANIDYLGIITKIVEVEIPPDSNHKIRLEVMKIGRSVVCHLKKNVAIEDLRLTVSRVDEKSGKFVKVAEYVVSTFQRNGESIVIGELPQGKWQVSVIRNWDNPNSAIRELIEIFDTGPSINAGPF